MAGPVGGSVFTNTTPQPPGNVTSGRCRIRHAPGPTPLSIPYSLERIRPALEAAAT